jgi:excisionase family DNA binding protein
LRLSDLLARPDVPIDFVVENLLVAGTVSCVAAKPKVGKSTFARNLSLRVSRGDEFLRLATKQGECIYLALATMKMQAASEPSTLGESYLTLKEAAEALRLSARTVREYVKRGEIKGKLIGKRWRFRRADLDAFFENAPSKWDFVGKRTHGE